MNKEKPIYWVGSSYNDLLSFPSLVKQEAGFQLHRVQNGFEPENWKPFGQVGSGVKEIRINENRNTYRVMYVAKFANKIYVLHSFQKKIQKTSLKDIEIAKTRYKAIIQEKKS